MTRIGSGLALTATAWILKVLLPVAAQARNPAHDMRDALLRRAGDQTATCVYCHAPQGARAEAAQAPRWQSSEPVAFSVYGGKAFDAATFEGGATLLCMSCHDATQAPVVGGSPNDHPVGVRYAGVRGPRSPLPDLQLPRSIDAAPLAHDLGVQARPRARAGSVAGFRAPARGVINDRTVWWVATSPNSARRTRSDLPLFTNEAASTAEGSVPTVECATCHDPHNDKPMFLRVSNDGSRLCLSCHDT